MLTFLQFTHEQLRTYRLCLLAVLWLTNALPVAQAQFTQKQKIVASDRNTNDYFGNSVDMSGNYAIVGAYNASYDANNSNFKGSAGAAYIYELQNGQFSQKQKLLASDRMSLDHFGNQAVISGTYAAIGASYNKTDANGANPLDYAGAVYVFERQPNGQWTQVAKLVEPDRAANREFGNTLAISGDFIVVGSRNNPTDADGTNSLPTAGAVHVFQRQPNGQWASVTKLVPSDRRSYQEFGQAVSIENNRILIGSRDSYDAQGNNYLTYAGAAYLFVQQPNGQWQQQAKLVAGDRSLGSLFGSSVSIAGNYIGVGALTNTTDEQNSNALSNAGSAYLFEQINGQWQQVSKVVAADRSAESFFGISVNLSGNRFLVGAYGTAFDASGSNPMPNAGGAYFFNRQPDGSWTQSSKIVANDRGSENYFGLNVALEGEMALVGASNNETDAVGGMAKQKAGAAYLFSVPSGQNQSPFVNQPIANQQVQFGSSYNFVIPASTFVDPEGQPLTLSATGLPNGISLNGSILSGTPQAVGDYTITITATDKGGLQASTSFVLQVKDVVINPPGNLQLTAPQYNCQTGAFSFQTTGGNGTPIEYFAIGIT
ncbi:putative Ig domain-containing protein, partial [Spirosoma harenae]